jgi:hypothetical protein
MKPMSFTDNHGMYSSYTYERWMVRGVATTRTDFLFL